MATPIDDPGFKVSHGPVATVEIGVEVKTLAKAMIKQIDHVIGDLVKQLGQFRRGAGGAAPAERFPPAPDPFQTAKSPPSPSDQAVSIARPRRISYPSETIWL